MTNAITPFAFDDALVQVHTDADGELLFIAKDVALASVIPGTAHPE